MNDWSNTEPVRYIVAGKAKLSLEAAFEAAQPGDTVIVEACRVAFGYRIRLRYERAATFWL